MTNTNLTNCDHVAHCINKVFWLENGAPLAVDEWISELVMDVLDTHECLMMKKAGTVITTVDCNAQKLYVCQGAC